MGKGIADIEKKVNNAKKEGIKEMAKAMKQKGLDVELIAELTGLTPTVIKRLKAE